MYDFDEKKLAKMSARMFEMRAKRGLTGTDRSNLFVEFLKARMHVRRYCYIEEYLGFALEFGKRYKVPNTTKRW